MQRQQQQQQLHQQQQQTFVQQQQQVSQQSVRRVEQHVTHQVTSQQHQQVQEMVIQGSLQPAYGGRPGNISPPVFEQIFRNARFAQGGNALFEGKVRGQPKPVVSWTRKGAPLLESGKYRMSYDEQSGKVSLLINTIGPGDEGEYTCTAQNQYGEAICSVYIQPEGQLQPQISGYQKEYAQTIQSMEQTQSTLQRYQKQMSAYGNGTVVEEDFKVDTFEYRLLREVEFRESITRRFIGEIDSTINTVVEHSLGPAVPPQIVQKPRNSKLQEGSVATFEARLTANPRPRLTWFKNGQRITSTQKYQTSFSNQQATLKVQNLSCTDSGHYTLLAENPQGCVVSSAYLAVEPSSLQDGVYGNIREQSKSTVVETTVETDGGKSLAPNFVRVCTDREVTEGKMTRFDCRVTGRPYPDVAWFINGRQVSDDATHKILVNESGNHALMITNVHRSDAGVVSCIARNKSGETSFQCNLLVIEKEQVVAPKFVERFTTVHVKEGEPVVLNARAVGTPVPRITWQKDGVPITPGQNINIRTDSGASTLDIPRAKASDAAWYQCTAQNVAGSTATRARLFVEIPKSSAPQPRRLNLPRPTKVIEPEPQPGPEVIYLRHVERVKPHAPEPQQDQIYPPPQFIIPLSDVQQVEGGRVHFEARIEPVGDPTMRVEWFINGRPLEASSRATTIFRFGFIALDLISIILEDSGQYLCRVTSSSGSVESRAVLNVTARASIEQSSQHPDSLQYIQQLEDYSHYQRQESLEETIYQRPNFIRPLQNLGELQEGRNAHFEAQLTPVSDPSMKVEWYKDGKTITASSRITTLFNFGYVSLNIMHLRVEDAGTYTVRAVNALGESISSSTLKILARTSVTGDLGIPEQQRYIEKVEELEAYQQQQQYKYTKEVPESTSPPEFKSPIQDQLNIHEGGFAHFEARLEPIGDSTLRTEWLKDGRPVEASSRITTFFNFGYVALTIKYVTTHDIGTYVCCAYNSLGQATTTARLTVLSKQDIILDSQHPGGLEKIQYLEDSSRYSRSLHEETTATQKPRFLGPLKGTNKIVEGQRAHFEVRVEPQNDINMIIEWYFNGKVIMSANRIQTHHDFGYIALDIENVRSEDAGTYTVVARNALGEAQISATMEVETRSSIDTSSLHHGTYEKTQRLESSKFVEPQYHIEEISKSKPIFVQPLQDPKPVSEGKNIHLECRLEPMGDPTMRVEWFYNGRSITVGSRFRTYYDFGYIALDIVHATSLDSGEYTVRASNHLGSAHTSACVRVISRSDILTESQNEAALEQIQILEDAARHRRTMQEDITIVQAPQFTRPLHNIETVEGTNIHLECRLQPVGDPTMRVDWFVNGRPVKTGHRFRPAYDFDYVALDLLSVYAVDSGVYTCQARNQLGEAVTSCSVKIIAKKDLILESQHPSGLEKIQYLEDASKYKRIEHIDEVVNVKPRFVTKPKSLDNMREGQHAHFECKLEPVTDSNLKVEWYKNGRPIIVGHRFRPIHDFGYVALDIIDLIAEDSGVYSCRAVNLVGADETTCSLTCRSTAQIVTGTHNEMGLEQIQHLEDRSKYHRAEYSEEITKQAPIFTTSLKHIEIKEGQRAHFECRLIPVSDPTMKVEWFHNNAPVKSGSRFTETNNFGFVALDITYCYPEDSGVYMCRARNALGEAVTSANLICHSKKSIYLESQHEEALVQLNYLEDNSRYQRQTAQEETVSQAPVFTQPMKDVKCAENQAAHFEARLIPVGDSKLQVEWLRNGVPIQASNRVTTMHDFGYVALNMKYVYPEDSGTYTCRAINELGQAVTSATLVVHSKASLLLESQHEGALEKLQMLEDSSRYQRREEEEVIVKQPPKFTAQLNGPTNLVEGQSAHYECRIEPYPDPNLKVEWFHNGKPLQTGHRFRTTYDFGFAALDILTVYGEDSGEYTCRATNKLGHATSSIKVNVKSRSSIILDTQHEGALQKIQYLEDDSRHKRTAAEDAVILEKPQFGRPLRNIENLPEGLSAHLEATLTPVNDPTMKVEWFCNGKPIPQGHRFKTTYDFGFVALDILYAYAEDSGTYMCKARNAVGEAVTTCSVKVQAKSGLYLDTLDEQRLKKIKDLEMLERPKKIEAEPEAQRPVFITPLNNLEHLKEGEHAHLECRVEPINDANLKIEWFVNGVAIKTGHRFRTTHDFGYVALDVLYTYPEDSGTYMCKATNFVGEAVNTCTISVAARRSIYLESQHPEGLQKIQELEAQGRPGRLEVEEPIPTPPRFITELRGTTELVEGQTAHFEAQVEPLHDPNLRIELYHNGKPLPSASRFHITFDFGYLALDISHIVPEDAGEYSAKAINALGQCTSTISVRVQGKSNIILESQRPEGLEKIRQLEEHTPFRQPDIPEPTRQRPVFTQPLQNIDGIAEGQTAHFECRLIPVGDPTLKVEWFRNEKPLETSSRITKTHDFGYVALDMTHVRGEDNGVYMCRASNTLGEAVTTASMKIKTKANIQLETQHPEGMKKIQQLEQGRVPKRSDEPDKAFEKPIFTQVLTGPSELWESQNAHFECRVVPVGDPSLRFEWYVNGVELKMGSRFHVTHDFGFVTLDIAKVVTEDSGVYMCKAINNAGEAVSSTSMKVKSKSSIMGEPMQPDAWQKIQLKEAEMNKVPEMFVDTSPQQAPVFTTHLTSHEKLVEGQHILLEAQVEPRADPNLRIEWFKNGVALTTGTRIRSTFDFGLVTLTINGLRADDSAIYTCKAFNLHGEAVSTCTIKVEDRHWLLGSSLRPEALPQIEALEQPKVYQTDAPEPVYESPVFITHLNNIECQEGESVHFECRVEPSKDPTLNIEWFVNGKPLPMGARFKSTYDFGYVALDINHAYAEDSGVYMCKATNSKGQASTSGTLKCTSKQNIYLDTQHPQGKAGLEKVEEVDEAYAARLQRDGSRPEQEFPKPIFIVPLHPEFSLGENEALHLECQVEPKEDPNLKVEWYFNGKNLEHGSRFKMTCDFGFVTLHLTDVYERDQGIYTCKAHNKQGEAFTSTTVYCKSKANLIEHTQHPKGAEGLEKIQDLEESLRRQEGVLSDSEEGHPPVFTSQFQNLKNLSEGEIAHFEASLTPVGDQTMTVEWFYNGEALKASHRTRTVHAFGMVVLEILGTKIEDSGNYTCRATNKWGRAEISVELECVEKSKGQKPRFTTQIQSLEGLKDGDSAHFECTLTPVGDPHLKVEWFHKGQPLRHSSRIKTVSDFGFVVLDIAYVQSHDSGEYVCRASNKYGEDFTKATIKCQGKGGVYFDTLQPDSLARIRELETSQGSQMATPTTPVLEPPVFTTHISDVTQLVEGQSAHFEARLTPVNDPNLTVEWFYNGKKLPHGHRYRTFHDFGIVILDILYCYEENSGVYECRAVNKVGQDVTKATLKCVSKANLILDSQLPQGMEGGLEKIQTLEDSLIRNQDEKVSEVKGQAPMFTVPLSNIDSLREGENAHFEARLIPTDDPKLKVEWFWNGKPLKTGSRFRTFCDFGFVILEISPVYPEDSGEYSCRAFNDFGQAVTTATMRVQGKRSIILESQLPKGMEHTIEKIAELEGLGLAPDQPSADEDVGRPPEFITTPVDLTLTENSLAHFECRLTPVNDSSMRVEWFHNGKALSAGSRIKTINDFGFVILEVAGVYQRDSGLYTCKATNRHGEATVSCKLQVRGRQGIILEPQLPSNFRTGTESIQKLEENLYKKDEILAEEEKPNPPKFIVELKDISDVAEGAPIHFECRVEPVGDSSMRIDWFHNGRPFATGSRVHMLNDFGFIVLDMDYTYARDSGEYVCRATNKWGSATTKATLTCKAKHDIVLESQLPQGMSGAKLKELERGPVTKAFPEDAPLSPPKFITQITSVGIGEGEPVHFECRVEPKTDPKLRIEWYRNGKLLPSGHRFRTMYDLGFVSLDILYTYPEDSGEYVCRAVNDLGEDTTRATISCKKLPTIILQNQVPKGMKKSEALMQMEATIKKYTSEIHLTEDDLYDPDKKQPPRFVTQIKDQTTLEEMQSTKFECQLAPVGDPNMKVEWFLNGKPLPHKNRFTPIYDFGYVAMNFGWVYPEDSGEYLCRATNLYGMDETRAVIKTAGKPGIIYESQLPKGMKSIERIREMEAAWQIVPEEPDESEKPKSAPVFVTKPETYTAVEGEPARFCCRVTGFPRPRVMWVVNGHTVVNGTRYKLTYDGMWHLDIPKTRQYDNGKVEVIARNSAGEAIAVADLVVKQRQDDYRNVLKNSPRHILGTKEYRKPEWVTHMEELQEALRATQCVPTFVQEIKDSRAQENESITFECQFSGNPMPDVTWYKNDKSLRNTKNIQIRIKNNKTTCTILKATPEDEGTYVCKAVSDIGTETTRAQLYVQAMSLEARQQIELKRAQEEEERIRLERVKLEKIEKRRKKKGTITTESKDKRTTAGVQETQVMETTTTFANTTEQVMAKPIVPIQDSVEVSAIASCKKVDETVEPIVSPREKAQTIVPTQESIQVSEIQIEDTVKDFNDERTKVIADRKTLVQESVSVSEVMTEQIAKKFTEEHTEVKAEHKLSVQDSLNVSEIISDITVQDFANEEVVEERAVRTTSIQKPLVVSEVQSEITVKELKDTQELVKADKKVSVQESVTVSEVQSEDIVEELADMTPKLHHAKPEKKAPTSEKVTLSQVKTEEIKQDDQVISKIVQERREQVTQSEEIIHKENFTHAEEILKTEQTKIATEIEELMNFIQAKEFGPGESPLRDLACIGYLVRNGITVNEITSLYQADRFPALQTPVAQSALVQLVEREGHGALISQVLTEETTTDEAVVGETVGFRAFMRMVELKHAAVEEVITHFSPEDFRPCAWEAQEAVEVVDKGMVQEKTQVTQEAEVLVQEKRKQKKKTKQRQEVETEGDISVPSTPKKEQVSPTIAEEKQSIGVKVVESNSSGVIKEAESVTTTEATIIEEERRISVPKEDDVQGKIEKVRKTKKPKTGVQDEKDTVTKELPDTLETGTPKEIPQESFPRIQESLEIEELTAEEIVQPKRPLEETANIVVDKKTEVSEATEVQTKVLTHRPSKKKKDISQKTENISEVELIEETTKEVASPKPVSDEASKTILLKEAVEVMEICAVTDEEKLKIVEETPQEAVVVQDKEKTVSISEVEVKKLPSKPSKKKEKDVKKLQIEETHTTENISQESERKPEETRTDDKTPVPEATETNESIPKPESKPVKKPSKKKKETKTPSVPLQEEIKESKDKELPELLPEKEKEREETEVLKPEPISPKETSDKKAKTKLPKPQKVEAVPQLMKIERKEIKPTKLKVTEVAPKEEVPLFAQIKLRKSSIQKREIKSTELPKVMLKSNLKVIEYPPMEQTPIITLINVKPDKGILSRNVEEALKPKKKRIKQMKDTEKEEVELEKPETFEIEEKEKTEEKKIEETTWVREPKKVQVEDVVPKELVIGKGKMPEIQELTPENIKLKKIPQKPQDEEVPEKEKGKRQEPEEIPLKDVKKRGSLDGLAPFVGKIDEGSDLELEKYEKIEPVKEEESSTPENLKKPKSKPVKPEQEVEEIPLKLGKPKKVPEEEEKDITLKKKMGEPVPEIPEEITLKPFKKEKPAEEPKEDIVKVPKPEADKQVPNEEQVTMKIPKGDIPEKKKTKIKKPKTEEKPAVQEEPLKDVKEETEEIIVTSPRKPEPKVIEDEEITQEITLKPKKKQPKVEEEVTLIKETEKPVEDINEDKTIRVMPKTLPTEDITETVNLKKKKPKKEKMKVTEDVEEAVIMSLSKKPEETMDDVSEEVTIKPKEPKAEELTEAVIIKKKEPQKFEVENVTEEITIKKIQPQKPDEEEDTNQTFTLKPKPKIPVKEEVSDETTVVKLQPEKPEEVEEVKETFSLKKKKKEVVSEDVNEEITIRKKKPVQLPEEVSEHVTLKQKKVKEIPTTEVSEEISITKLMPRKPIDDEEGIIHEEQPEEVIEEIVLKKLSKQKPSVEEISEEVTLKPKPKRKSVPEVNEVSEVETIIIKPRVTKTKEEIEQEFKIQLQTYEEEDISMSGRVRLRKQKPMTYGEETGEQTITITQEVEQEGPEEIVEIIEEEPEEGVTIELRRKPSYHVEEPLEEIIHLGYPTKHQSDEVEGSFQVQLKSKEVEQSYLVEEVEEEFKIGLKKENLAPRGSLYEEESLAVKLKPKEKPPKTLHQEAVSLSITRETEVFEEGVEEVIVTEYEEGHKFYSLCSYVADNEDALNLVEGERVYILETHNSDWWFVKKHLTEQKGWVPAQLLMDEPSYTLYVQKKLHEKIDKLPVFEKPTSEDKVSAPRFVEKLKPKHATDGVTVQFECHVEGSPRPQITWFKQTAVILPSSDFQMYYDDDNVATLIVKEAFPEDAGTYTCVAKNAAGFASSSTELIVEGPLSDHGSMSTPVSRRSLSRESSLADILEGIPPLFSRKPKHVCVKEGDDVEIECRLVAVPKPDIIWNCRNKKIKSGENTTVTNTSDMHMYTSVLQIKKVKKSQEGVYEVIAQNREGESKVSITLKVLTAETEPPELLEPLTNVTVDEGDGIIISTQIVGNPTPKIVWEKSGEKVPQKLTKTDGITHTLTLPNATLKDAGLYTVRATNVAGSVETSATLNIIGYPEEKMEPPLFIERFEEVKVPENGNLRLTAKVTGSPVPNILWLRNNIPLKPSSHVNESFDGQNIVLEITNVNSEVDAGDYKCVASNPAGKACHGAKISVDVEKVTFTKLLEKTVNIDERETLSLECETSHTVPTKWFLNGKELSGMDHRIVIQEGRVHRLVIKEINLQDSGKYTCTVKKQVTESHVKVLEGKPDFTRKLQDLEVKERELAVLEVEVSSETADVSWHKDGEQISEQHEKFVFEKQGGMRRLLIRGTSVHDEGEYTCVVGEQECTAEVTVVELPPEIITRMQNVTIAKGEKATFEIELTKGDALVRWFKDGNELQFSEHIQLSIDGKRQKLKVYNCELEDSGEYSCQVGEQTSSAKLTVEEPVVEFLTKLPDVTLVPLSKDATFTVELSRPNVEVVWLKNGKEIKPSDHYSILAEGSVRKLIVKNATLDDQADFTCMAVNVKTSSKLKIEIIERAPKINMEALKEVYKVRKGDDVDIEVKYTATPTPKEEWFVNGKLVKKSKKVTPVLTEYSAVLSIKKVEEIDTGNYTIKLVNNCGEASADLKLVLMEVPSPPGHSEVVEITNNSVTLHWKVPETDGNSPIINYIVEFHDKSNLSWKKCNENYNITETTHRITNLQQNKEYVFRVSAVNEIGQSQPSQETQYIKITAPVKAEAPNIQEPLKSVITGISQPVNLSCVISGIPAPNIQWFKNGQVFSSENITYENCVSKYVVNKSTSETAGTYRCYAKNDSGFAETTCEVKIQDPPKLEYDETLITQKLRVTNQWKIEVKVSGYPKPDSQWTKNGKILASTKHCTVQTDETSSTIAVSSLTKSDSGTYTFTARNEAGVKSVDFTVRVIDKPSKPEGPMVVKDIRRESVVIEWKPPADDGGLELSKYSVEKCDIEKMIWMKVADVEKDVSSYCVQQLKEDAEYMFRVIAENPVGSSEALESDTVTIRSKFDKPSPPRGPLDISGMRETAFTVAWQPPESDGGAPILEYIVERKEVGKKAWKKVGSTSGEITHVEVTELKHNTSYHFRITARNDIGLSAPFTPEEPVTAGKRISAPSAPANFSVIDITSKSVTLQWSPPVSTGGTELTGYIVEKRLASSKKWIKVVTLEPSITQHCIENLKEKSEWFFRVYAENSIGLSPPASTELVSLKTHASPPSPPTAPLEIRSISPNSIIIEWGIPETDGGAPIEGYTIAIRDIKKTMWMEVGRVRADVQKLAIRDLQENHEYLIRIFARNEVGLSEPLESDEAFKVLRPTDAEQLEVDKLETTAPTLSFSTETTTSWMREAGMDADIHSYARGSLLRRDEYFFRIWYYARQLFK